MAGKSSTLPVCPVPPPCISYVPPVAGTDPVTCEPLPLVFEVSDLINKCLSLTVSNNEHLFACVHNIRPVLQVSRPMCGLVALSMASQLIHSPTDAEPLQLLKYAKENGYTKQGEIFSSQHLLTIAQATLSCSGEIIDSSKITPFSLINFIASNKAILVPYDCDKDHTPCQASGHLAHWCIIVGVLFFADADVSTHPLQLHHETTTHCHFISPIDPQISTVVSHTTSSIDDLHVFVRHGKSRHLGLWSLNTLMSSCSNLSEFNPRKNPQDYILPDSGIKECLCSKIVILTNESCL